MSYEELLNRKYSHLYSFDPGGNTGLAIFVINWSSEISTPLSRIVHWSTHLISGDDVEQWSAMHNYLFGKPNAVVSEDFILDTFSQSRELLSPVRNNALLKWFCWQNRTPICFQPRELAMSTATDERLKRWGFYVGQKDERAAVKHGLTFIRRCNDDVKLRKQFFSTLREKGNDSD